MSHLHVCLSNDDNTDPPAFRVGLEKDVDRQQEWPKAIEYGNEVGDDARDLVSMASKWSLCGPTKPSQDGFPSTYQDFTSRCPGAAQVIWVALVQYGTSWQPIRPTLVLDCLSLRRPLGRALGFYRFRIRHLDVAHFTAKASWGNQAWQECSPATLPRFTQVLSNIPLLALTCFHILRICYIPPYS